MRYYIIAGEASGDLHGSNLIKALRQCDPEAEIRCWGGDLMEAAGGQVVKHYRDLAFMGFVEVLLNIRTILGNLRYCKSDILAFRPDALILIDYPGFNLRIAKWASEQKLPVHYYISPQVWAWHSSRVHGIKRSVKHLYTILPFEEAFYAKYDLAVDYVGHPLLDVVRERRPDPQFRQTYRLDDRPIIALLPGSRRQEIKRMLSVMLAQAARFPDYQFVVAGAPSIEPEFYQAMLQEHPSAPPVQLIPNRTYDLLQAAHAALVTSGTATLETALFGVPQVVCYRGNPLSYWIARRLVNVSYISLVNLIVDQPLVEELIQDDLNPDNLQRALRAILDPAKREDIRRGYDLLSDLLGQGGASRQTAGLIVARTINPAADA